MATHDDSGGENRKESAAVFCVNTQPTVVRSVDWLIRESKINPPPFHGKDRTQKDRERYKDRLKKDAKKRALDDVLDSGGIVTGRDKVRIPAGGGETPIYRPGRDRKGGQGKGGKPGQDKGDYIEVTFDEFLEWFFFDAIKLPNMLKKQFAKAMVKRWRRRGLSEVGPKVRLSKPYTERERKRRAAATLVTQPELFVAGFKDKCQEVFDAYIFYASASDQSRPIFPEPVYARMVNDVEMFLSRVETVGTLPPVQREDAGDYRKGKLAAVVAYLETHKDNGFAPYTCDEELSWRIEAFVLDTERAEEGIPDVFDVPFNNSDLRYHFMEERKEPEASAVAFMVKDRSGSTDGEPLRIMKAYFLINVIFLKMRYEDVKLVFISHDGQAYLWKSEQEFFNIGASGGTAVLPALKLVFDIAETGAKNEATGNFAGPFPLSTWNRYMFYGTDGDLFDDEKEVRLWWTKIVREAQFNYTGYLEVGTSWSGWSKDWRSGGLMLLGLPPDVKEFVGMAKANNMQEVGDAFVQILDKDRKKGA
jgi:uncharacterized sporulation protein YeaH/YhbH (DUF444 family)